ncbi:MAG: hypothetical protein ACI4MP_12305 [Candidatus Ventricola sp.]
MSIAFSLVVLLSLIVFPQDTSGAAARALRVWGLDVVPSLFPYMVLCRLLSGKLRERDVSPAPVSALLGLMGGSPSGASVISAYGSRLSKRALLALSALTGTISPMFMLGTIETWTQNAVLCRLLLLCHLLGAACAGIVVLLACRGEASADCVPPSIAPVNPIAQSVDAILQVGGCIICYSVLAALLSLLPFLGKTSCAVLHGLLEISGGVHALCAAPMPDRTRAVLMASLCGFSGFSILSQNHAFLGALGVRMTQLIAFALLRAVIAGCLMAVLYPCFIP